MNSEIQSEQPVPAPDAPVYSVPWKFIDNWIGVGLLALVQLSIFAVMWWSPKSNPLQSVAVILLEAAYLLPLVLILAWRHVNWKHLGFGKFEWKDMGIGCGLLIASYSIIFLYGLLLLVLGIETQGQQIARAFAKLDSPIWFIIGGTIAAPLVEETFFRGFLFQGLRERYGWVIALLISAAIFAVGHLDLVTIVPAFILGCVLAYVYHRSNSVWPGVILHFLNNAFAFCGIYVSQYLQNVIPS